MADDGVRFVQFPHPGSEHNPPDDDMPWNVAGHRRKFLITPGDYLDADARYDDIEVVFWGEWEPPSRIERRWPASDRLPRALHRPYWIQPQTSGFRENTDPWVFGAHMIYSVCKQITGPHRRPTSMQRLPRGSVICFGSTIAGEFCIDTAFVVASAEPWVPADAAGLDVDDAFKICTADSIATTESDLGRGLDRAIPERWPTASFAGRAVHGCSGLASGVDVEVFTLKSILECQLNWRAGMVDAGGRPKLLKRPERRRALMDAAARAFARGGYAATSLEDVAAEAGVTRALIYQHFDSKTQLYRALLDDMRDKLQRATGAPERLEPASLGALVRIAQTHADQFRLFFRHASREPEFREHADWLRTAMTDAAQPYLREVLPDDQLRRWAAELLPAVAIEAILAWLDSDSPQPDDAAATVGAMIGGVIDAIRRASTKG